MDIREILRQIRAGESERAISRSMKVDRATVKRYRAWAEQNGLLAEKLPPIEELERLLKDSLAEKAGPQNVSSVEPYRALVEDLRGQGGPPSPPLDGREGPPHRDRVLARG